MAQKKKRHGCLIFILVIILILGSLAFITWSYVLHSPPNSEAVRIINGPIDTEISRQLTNELVDTVGPGITLAIVPIPNTQEKGAVIVINTADGFKPASGQEGKRQQIMKGINTIIKNNTQNALGLSGLSLTYEEDSNPIIAVASSMENIESLASGTMTEMDFAGQMDLEIKDLTYILELINNE